MGSVIGIDAFHFAEELFNGAAGTCANGSDHMDSDGDGFADGCDRCALTTPLDACLCSPGEICCRDGCLIGDGNGDGVRDLSDFATLQNCFSGSDQSPGYTAPDTDCLFGFSVDEDTDVDFEEYFFFYDLMTNP